MRYNVATAREDESLNPRLGSVLANLAIGTHQLLPAPPPGFLHRIAGVVIRNMHASAGAEFTVQDGDGVFIMSPIALLSAGSQQSDGTGVARSAVTTRSAISITIAQGGPMNVHVAWYRMPEPPGLKIGVVAMTGSFQTVPNVVPSAGLARPWGRGGDPISSGRFCEWTMGNTGGSNFNFTYRLIRAGVTYDVPHAIGAAVQRRVSQIDVPAFVFQPGDVFQISGSGTPAAGSLFRCFVEPMEAA